MTNYTVRENPFIDELMARRRVCQNGNNSGFIIGMPGSGKPIVAKEEILSILKNTEDTVVVLASDVNYRGVAKEMNGQIIRMGLDLGCHINLFDIDMSDVDIISLLYHKEDVIVSWIESILGLELSALQKFIVSQCVREAYKPFLNKYTETGECDTNLIPTLQSFCQILCNHQDDYHCDIKEVVGILEIFVSGCYQDVFAHPSSVQYNNRFIVYDFDACGHQLKSAAFLTALEHVWINLVKADRDRCAKRIWIFVDDIRVLLNTKGSLDYFGALIKTAKKFGCTFTCAAHSADIFLDNDMGRSILANCAYLHLLRLPKVELDKFAETFNLPSSVINYIANSPAGRALVYEGYKWTPCSPYFAEEKSYSSGELYNMFYAELKMKSHGQSDITTDVQPRDLKHKRIPSDKVIAYNNECNRKYVEFPPIRFTHDFDEDMNFRRKLLEYIPDLYEVLHGFEIDALENLIYDKVVEDLQRQGVSVEEKVRKNQRKIQRKVSKIKKNVFAKEIQESLKRNKDTLMRSLN